MERAVSYVVVFVEGLPEVRGDLVVVRLAEEPLHGGPLLRLKEMVDIVFIELTLLCSDNFIWKGTSISHVTFRRYGIFQFG